MLNGVRKDFSRASLFYCRHTDSRVGFHAVLGPLFYLVEIAIVREKQIVCFLVQTDRYSPPTKSFVRAPTGGMLRQVSWVGWHQAAVRSLITRDQLFFDCRFRSRTPGPPPFSSMNSTPVDSRARRGSPLS